MIHSIEFNFATADAATDVPDWLGEQGLADVIEWHEAGRGVNGWPDIRFSGQPTDLARLIAAYVDGDPEEIAFHTTRIVKSA